MCRPNAGEALGLGFDHRTKVVAAVGALLLQVEPDRGQVFVADRLGKQGAIGVCTDRLLDGVRAQQRILAEPAQARAARPRKCGRVVRHAGADGVQVDVAAAAHVSTLHDVLRNAWQVESRLAGHVRRIAAALATLRGHNAGVGVGIRRAGLSEVNLILFPRTPFPVGCVSR